MKGHKFEVNIYSPRWGHDDTYSFSLNSEEMRIEMGKNAKCFKGEKGAYKWSGYRDIHGNPLVKILENDGIYPPTVLPSALESAWTSWLDEELDDEQVQNEIQVLFEWVNLTSHNKPNTDFWSGIF